MSMPKFPNTPNLNLENSVSQVISSIAMEELALSHVLNAEGEKLQFVLGSLNTEVPPIRPITIDDLLEVNESIRDTLSTVSMNQMFLLGKMSSVINAYCKLKDSGDYNNKGDDNDNQNGDDDNDDDLDFMLKDGPYDTRIDEGDWENKSFSVVMKIRVEEGVADPHITVIEKGSIKLEDILYGDDFGGIIVKDEDGTLSNNFWIDTDKVGDDAIVYDYFPELSVWDDAEPGLPVVEKTLILSRVGYKDARIRVILRYNGSLYTKG